MRAEDGARCKHDSVALRCLRERKRVLDVREARPHKHSVCGFDEQLHAEAIKCAHHVEARLAEQLVQAGEILA